ncbi:PBSX family phage terminase large subunit [Methylobacterium haplocladii]|uniref:PBSX family phage terminase large subunit n=1 Tax=Methylobacterium haplocladii TaxID=1176176 RepID=UPI001AEE2CA6|nr:PBSX family phage terminase large subunit [Methylobacterium haplocladii]
MVEHEGRQVPIRYRAAYGGRGSGKSHAFAQALVIRGANRTTRALCCREIQKSLKSSVKRLLSDKIRSTGLSHLYSETETEIRGPRDTLFLFEGLRSNPDSVKSMEGLDLAWVEEANTVSQRSLDLLIPTVRKPGSEIWFTWNPKNSTDPVDAMLRGAFQPPGTLIERVNFDDNPFFPEVLRADMEFDLRRDPDKYAHVWLGEYLRNSEARVFKNWKAEEFETPPDAVFYLGADWGFSVDPTVLVRCFVRDRTLFVDREVHAVGCEIDHTPAFFAGNDTAQPPRWENTRGYEGIPGALRWIIRADSARPETISYMQRRGFRIEPATKGPGSVEEGVEFLKSYDIVVHPRCKHTIDELTLYSYKTDPLTENVLPVLQDKKNHVIDALRYSIEKLRINSRSQSMFDLVRQEAETARVAEAVHNAIATAADARSPVPSGPTYAAGSVEAMKAALGG